MKLEQMKTIAKTVEELSEDYVDLLQSVKGTAKDLEATRELWRDGKKSRLIKLGLALIICPEPTPISETVGSCLVAAGAVQKAIKNRAIYVGDVYKAFQHAIRDVRTLREELRL